MAFFNFFFPVVIFVIFVSSSVVTKIVYFHLIVKFREIESSRSVIVHQSQRKYLQ